MHEVDAYFDYMEIVQMNRKNNIEKNLQHKRIFNSYKSI